MTDTEHAGATRSTVDAAGSSAARHGSGPPEVRPQRLHTWFNLIPVAAYERERPREILFLDTFVTIEVVDSGNPPYRVRLEGEQEMTVVVDIGLIFVWYGEDLATPDRPFPELFPDRFDSAYVSSPPTVFENTHVMDFVENGSDNLHFTAVHLWDQSRIYDHVVSPETITLKQDTRFRYGKCSNKRHIRLLSRVLPELELKQDYVYHGPGLAVVGAEGKGSPDMHSLVTLTPEGPDRTRVHVTIALAPSTFPSGAERAFAVFSPGRRLRDVVAGIMAGYIRNEFDIDAIIWANRRHSHNPSLLPAESHLHDVIAWGRTFYPPDFEILGSVEPASLPPRWRVLDRATRLSSTEVTAYEIGGEHLAAYRDELGEPRVFPAHCPHQGAHFGHGGTIEQGCMRCPFHGLHFDPDGRCIGRNPDKRGKAIEPLGLGSVPHRIVDDWVEVYV